MSENLIEWLKLLLLALVQGFTEILPISSSGHILVLENLMGLNTSLTFSVFLHLGSLLAVFIFFHREIKNLCLSFFSYIFKKNREEQTTKNFHFIILLMIATLPAGIIGVLFNDAIDQIFYRPIFVILGFYITALLLFLIRYTKTKRTIEQMTWKDALYVGLAQAIGIIPGISRSGITISALKSRNLDDDSAAHFSFFMLMPVTLGSFIVEVIKVLKTPLENIKTSILPISVCVIVSLITTYISLHLFLKLIKKGKLWYFSLYLITLATLLIFLLK